MAVNVRTEHIFPLADVTKLPCIPRRRGRRGLHPSTVWRWAMKGVRGIKLEVVRAGGTLCTSQEAIQRFFERLADVPESEVTKKAAPDAAAVERELDAFGV